MKKAFLKGTLQEVSKAQAKNGLIVAYRVGSTYHLQNLELNPKAAFELLPSADKNELILKIKMNDGDFLVLQDAEGVAEKGTI
jgi:hypothetical protein